ncbi:MAG: hypothetical protein JSW66_01495 [Phycisphaerales bacterium]|nr:MAG: hypothetical protein JSW66_01495 [Phycisphaerales bacterium]
MKKRYTDKIAPHSLGEVRAEHWANLSRAKIFFGRQSVGYNIIHGIADIADQYDQIELNIVETHAPAQVDRPMLAHARIGRNTDPHSKIESFKNIMNAGLGQKVDIAFFKFCYVDIMRDSDAQEIFDAYAAAIEGLKLRYSTTKFLHVTVPLCSMPRGGKKGLKQAVKSLIGIPGVLDDNIMRERYNELLRNAYSQAEPIFDIALMESTTPNGLKCHAAKRAQNVPVMVPEYSDDGGHLNARGRKRMAEQLLIILAGMAGEC